LGNETRIERDASGAILSVIVDGTAEELEYDPRGDLVRATSPSADLPHPNGGYRTAYPIE
jgi:YD repeat-containing protein